MKKEFLKSKILLQVSINIFTCCVEKKKWNDWTVLENVTVIFLLLHED